MPASNSGSSLRQIAQELDLSIAAVSMALRGHPEISRSTIERVTALAAKVGYRTNPLLQSVMSHVRSASVRRMWLNFAFVWLDATPQSVRTNPFQAQTIRSVTGRARQLGLHLEQFYLTEAGMTAQRLEQILLARGISGMIFSPSATILKVDLAIDWSKFSVVVMGNVPWSQNFQRSGHNHYRGMCLALEEVARLGYRRPAIVLKENLNERAERTPEAAFLTHHPLPSEAAALVFRLGGNRDKETTGFHQWTTKLRPDCLLFPFMDGFSPSLDGISIGKRHFHAGLDLAVADGTAGIHYAFEAVGSKAVDLLITQMLHNERGIQTQAQTVLADGTWQDGPSLPPLPPGPKEPDRRRFAAGRRRSGRRSSAARGE